MHTREQFQAIMGFQPFDRLPLLEWAGWWDKTIQRWHGEGLPADLTDRYEICRHFGLEVYRHAGLQPYGSVPRGTTRGGRQAGILARTDGYDSARAMMYPAPNLDRNQWLRWAEEQARGDTVVWLQIEGFFWFPREVLGVERHLYAYYNEPALIQRMNRDLAEWNVRALEEVCSLCTPDFVSFAEDMSYNHGPMISKPLFDGFMKPYYERIVPFLNERGIASFVDSDGDVTLPARWFEEAGIEGILPLERQAGVGIDSLRKEHPNMKFIGHFDKMTMDKGEEAMRAEFERLLPTAAGGGFLISCDHQTPPGVSYENYKTYVNLFREYSQKAGDMSRIVAGPRLLDDG
jgi:hypothetical protein